MLCNFIEIILRHECSPVNLLHIFRIPFPKNTFGGMLLDFYVKVKSQTKLGRQMDTDRETHNTFTDFTRRYEVPQNTVIERSRRHKYIQKLYNMIYWKYAYGNIHIFPYEKVHITFTAILKCLVPLSSFSSLFLTLKYCFWI